MKQLTVWKRIYESDDKYSDIYGFNIDKEKEEAEKKKQEVISKLSKTKEALIPIFKDAKSDFKALSKFDVNTPEGLKKFQRYPRKFDKFQRMQVSNTLRSILQYIVNEKWISRLKGNDIIKEYNSKFNSIVDNDLENDVKSVQFLLYIIDSFINGSYFKDFAKKSYHNILKAKLDLK